jgi:hypothetical protein
MREPKSENDARRCTICGCYLKNLKAEDEHYAKDECKPVIEFEGEVY